MKRVTINFDKNALLTKSLLKKEYTWDKLTKATICRATPTLVDELAIVFDTNDGEVFIVEGDTGFMRLVKALNFDNFLPENWYSEAEQGKVFTLKLNNHI